MRSLAVLALLLASACSSSSTREGADPADEYVDALAALFTAGDVGPPLDGETGRCAATAMVDLVTAPALRAADVTPSELADATDLTSLGVALPADAVTVLTAAFADCGVGDAIEEPYVRAFAAESGDELTDDAVACVVRASSSARLEAGLAALFIDVSDGDQAFEELAASLGACPDAITQLLVNGFGQSAGGPIDAATAACVAEVVQADPEGAAATFSDGGAAADAFGAALVGACPGLGGG